MSDGWTVLDTVVELDTEWCTVGYDVYERPDGREERYYWMDQPDAVNVVALDGEEIVMLEQDRPWFDGATLECPGGYVDAGEDFETAARRELREEAGFVVDDLTIMDTYRPVARVRMERAAAVATGTVSEAAAPEDGEFLEVRRVPREEVVEAVAETGAGTGWTVTALALADARGHL